METLGRFGHKSLPTYYKGITFRSRLEARWAIILDQLGIDWEYEPEPIWIDGTSHFDDPYNPTEFGYLPDFYLPKFNAILEIKGHMDEAEFWRLQRAAYQITGQKAWTGSGGMPFIVGGNLGTQDECPQTYSVYRYGQFVMTNWCFLHPDEIHNLFDLEKADGTRPVTIGGDGNYGINYSWADLICNDFHGHPYALVQATNIARSTRFDWGHNV